MSSPDKPSCLALILYRLLRSLELHARPKILFLAWLTLLKLVTPIPLLQVSILFCFLQNVIDKAAQRSIPEITYSVPQSSLRHAVKTTQSTEINLHFWTEKRLMA
jgi:hypothetical protein